MNESDQDRVRDARQSFDLSAASVAAAQVNDSATYRLKVFKSGNSLALRLPKALGLIAGMELDLRVRADGMMELHKTQSPKKLDVSGFWGKCPWLQPIPPEMREFEERPSTVAARKAAEGKA